MKQYSVLLVLAAASACVGAQGFAPTPRVADLRTVLRQGAPAGQAVKPRQLSPEERAELRRQLAGEAGRGGKRP